MRLTVLYDAHCGLCRQARDWLARQVQIVPLRLVPAASPLAVELYPQLEHDATLSRFTVVDQRGGIYRGDAAWLMCLYALREYRTWALRFAKFPWRLAFRLGVWCVGSLRSTTACAGECRVRG